MTVPEGDTGSERGTLARYLWGAGLLGAEHLQYAENLLLGAWDIVRQNVADNIIYSEIRCSTTGYTDGGMNEYSATDLLCLGFDLAAVYYGVVPVNQRKGGDDEKNLPQRWVRVNLLLGAKRHKTLAEIHGIIQLVQYYIRRGAEVEATDSVPHERRAASWHMVGEVPRRWL